MKKLSVFATAALLALGICASASAQVSRVFLGGTGNDANDCSNITTPCRSLQGAIDQTPVQGEIIILTSGGFGTATVDKSLTIDASTGVVAFNARTLTVDLQYGEKVVIRGLSMNGKTFGDSYGVYFTGSDGVLILENTTIAGFNNGVFHSAAYSTLVVNHCEFRNNQSNGIGAVTGGQNTYLIVENSRFTSNGNSIYLGSAMHATLRNSILAGGNFGLLMDGVSPGETVTIDSCLILDNVVGINVNGQNQLVTVIRVTNSTIFANTTALQVLGAGQIISYGTNRLWGNGTNTAFTSTISTM